MRLYILNDVWSTQNLMSDVGLHSAQNLNIACEYLIPCMCHSSVTVYSPILNQQIVWSHSP